MRWVMARVLPVPAPASTHIGPAGWAATSRCSGSRASRTASAPGCTGRVVIASILGAGCDADGPRPTSGTAGTASGSIPRQVVFRRGPQRPAKEPDVRPPDRPDPAPARHGHDVHDDVVRLLPPPEVADGAR